MGAGEGWGRGEERPGPRLSPGRLESPFPDPGQGGAWSQVGGTQDWVCYTACDSRQRDGGGWWGPELSEKLGLGTDAGVGDRSAVGSVEMEFKAQI